MATFKTCTVAVVATALTWLAASYAGADVVTLNFDNIVTKAQAQALDANGSYVGADAAPYLAQYGITLDNISPNNESGEVRILNMGVGAPNGWQDENALMQLGWNAPPCSYTMNFSTPLQSISFTRITAAENLETTPVWSATAYVGAEAVGVVGEAYGSWGYGSPAQTFTLSGDGITSLTIYQNGFYFTGIGAVPLDHFVLNEVPEPSTFIMLLGAFAIAAGWWRRRWAAG